MFIDDLASMSVLTLDREKQGELIDMMSTFV